MGSMVNGVALRFQALNHELALVVRLSIRPTRLPMTMPCLCPSQSAARMSAAVARIGQVHGHAGGHQLPGARRQGERRVDAGVARSSPALPGVA